MLKKLKLRDKILAIVAIGIALMVILNLTFYISRAKGLEKENVESEVELLSQKYSLLIQNDIENSVRRLESISNILIGMSSSNEMITREEFTELSDIQKERPKDDQESIIDRKNKQYDELIVQAGAMRQAVKSLLISEVEGSQIFADVGAYFKPNMFDGLDEFFTGGDGYEMANMNDGSFVPLATRNGSELAVEFTGLSDEDKELANEAMENMEVHITPLTTTQVFLRNRNVVTIYKPIIQSSHIKGVIKANMLLDVLQQKYSEIKPLDTGFLRIVDDKGTIIVDPVSENVGTLLFEDSENSTFQDILKGKIFNYTEESNYLETEVITYVYPVKTEYSTWSMLMTIPKSELSVGMGKNSGKLIIIDIVLFLLIMAAVVFLLINSLKPIKRINSGLETLLSGNNNVNLNEFDMSNDEISVTAQGVSRLAEKMRMQTEIANRIQEGDPKVIEDIKKKADSDEMYNKLESIFTRIDDLRLEMDKLHNKIKTGDFSKRLNETKFHGIYRNVVRTMNDYINFVNDPLDQIKDVLSDAEKNANFEGRITSDVKGDYGEIKELINNLMAQISSFSTESKRVWENVINGNYNISYESEYNGEFKTIVDLTNEVIENLNKIFLSYRKTSKQLELGIDEVSKSSQDLSQGSTEQASSIQQLSASIEQLSNQFVENAKRSDTAKSLTLETKDSMNKGNNKMKDLLEIMDKINKSASDISNVIRTIDDIAFQTNMLALNATVEASRAGEHGKGFAVVAEEVRNLAERSAVAAKETEELISISINNSKSGTQLAYDTATVLDEVAQQSLDIVKTIDEISKISKEQSDSVEQINEGINQISKVVQNNSAIAEETASASNEISTQAKSLAAKISGIELMEIEYEEEYIDEDEDEIEEINEDTDIDDIDEIVIDDEQSEDEENKNNNEKEEFGKY